jgi:hypothetical protein
MCCLKYEQDAYEDLLRNAPKNESFVDTPDGRGTVIEVDLMRQRVKVKLEEQTDTAVWHKNADIAVLRSGKAKKNDPPIPADLAPISGGGKRKKEVREEEENTRYLDSIRLRYSEETIAEETTAQEETPVTEEKPEKKENRKNRRNRRQKVAREAAPEQVSEKAEAPEKPESAENEGNQEKKKRNFHHRRHFHHKKPKSGEGNS